MRRETEGKGVCWGWGNNDELHQQMVTYAEAGNHSDMKSSAFALKIKVRLNKLQK